jgi:dTDP-glucose 4,6-dehydratase
MRISIFRPRLIIGPGRLGILSKLFTLIDANLPVPMIGSGRNPYQFISVFDCAEAARLAWRAGVPNEAYNLGSDNPAAGAKAARRPDQALRDRNRSSSRHRPGP